MRVSRGQHRPWMVLIYFNSFHPFFVRLVFLLLCMLNSQISFSIPNLEVTKNKNKKQPRSAPSRLLLPRVPSPQADLESQISGSSFFLWLFLVFLFSLCEQNSKSTPWNSGKEQACS